MSSISFAVLALAAVPRLAFEGPSGWVLADQEGTVVQQISELSGLKPIDLALSPDDRTIAFTAAPDNGLPQLFRWNGEKAERLSPSPGFHASPQFSPNGKEVMFVHHPGGASGAPGAHGAGQNGQLWRIGIDGTGLRQVTDSLGCKSTPRYAGPSIVIHGHNTCDGRQGIDEVIVASASRSAQTARVIAPPRGFACDPAVSPTGRRLAYLNQYANDTQLVILTERNGKLDQEIVATLPGRIRRSGLVWTADGKRLLFIAGKELHRFDVEQKLDTVAAVLTSGGTQ